VPVDVFPHARVSRICSLPRDGSVLTIHWRKSTRTGRQPFVLDAHYRSEQYVAMQPIKTRILDRELKKGSRAGRQSRRATLTIWDRKEQCSGCDAQG
jgi:hypothetical protein